MSNWTIASPDNPETDNPCLTAYEAGYLRQLLEDLEEERSANGEGEDPVLGSIAGKIAAVDLGAVAA